MIAGAKFRSRAGERAGADFFNMDML